MDAFLDKFEALARLAAGEAALPLPAPDTAGIMARIADLEPEDEAAAVPLTLFAGGAAAAAAAAALVALAASPAWVELSGPLAAMNSLAGVMDIML
ncbi:MAG: hypothetical protein LBU64_03075 [Planctomycetota bacterium]|jgi:hypothetical protein|nr:hypothetical protein [Planctomycetota bacterium]